MNDLLECKDLLHNERVIAACEGLGVELTKTIPSISSGIIQIDRSLADTAFEMRDQCVINGFGHEFADAIYNLEKPMIAPWWVITSRHWIIAATLAWEATQ